MQTTYLNHAAPFSADEGRRRELFPIKVWIWCTDGDELADIIGEFQREDPPDEAAKVMADDDHCFDAECIEKIFEFFANHIWPVVVSQHRFVRIVEALQVQSEHAVIPRDRRYLIPPAEEAVREAVQ